MPILSSIAGAAARAYSNAKRIITDTFNRADGSLGTTSSGHLWSVLRGTWSTSSNKATSSTSGSSYPLASVDIGSQNVVVSADITDGGPGLAFWVTDANSWWASSVNYRSVQTGQAYYTASLEGGGQLTQGYYSGTTVSTACSWFMSNPQSGYASFNSFIVNQCTGLFTSNLVSSQTTYSCSGGKTLCNTNQCCDLIPPLYSCANCTAATATTTYTVYTVTNYTPAGSYCDTGSPGTPTIGGATGNCGSFTGATYAPTTCTGAGGNATNGGGNCGSLIPATYNYITELKLYKNESGTISTVATESINTSSSSYTEANSLKAATNGNNITITAYQGSSLASPFATSLTNSPANPTKGTKVGIIKTSSTDNAGSLIDNFSAESL